MTDWSNHRIQKFSSTGAFITKWGNLGIGDGDFNQPEGIAIDASGHVYIIDLLNSRVQKFTSTGTFISKWGSTGTGNGQFSYPYGIAASANGGIYVVDNNSGIHKFTNTGEHQASYGPYGWANGTLRHPRGVVTDPQGNVYITDSNHRIQKFSVLDIFSLSSSSGAIGSSLTITGNGFSTTPSENVVKINGTTAIVTATSATSLTVTVPTGATTGRVSVTRAGFTAQSANEFLVLPLSVTSFTPSVGSAGANVVVNGTGFSSIAANNEVKFNGITAEVTSSTPTSLIAKIPAGNTVGKITVRVNGVTAASANDFSGVLSFTSFTPNKALAGASVTITGTGFSSTPANQLVQFNGVTATVTASTSTSLTITVPVGATTGKLSVIREGTTVLSTTEFLALPLSITSFTPGIGIVGAPITISGTGFSTVNANNSVSFNGSTATVTSSTATTINTLVPLTSTNGKILVTVNGVTATSVLDFTITKLAITQSNYPQFFVDGDAGAAVRLTVNDINEVLSAKVYWRGITQDEGALSSASIPHTISSNEVQVSVPASFFIDPLGLFLKIVLADKSGNEITGTHHNIYMKYPTTSTTQVIPNLKFGKKANSYQLIAIPLELTTKSTTSVFADLGNYDTKKWRLFSYDGSIRENPASINTGQGYWFIMSNTHEINPGEGNVVKVTQGDPYKISLRADWNLIGNPYNFNISWEDVLEHNGLNETQLKFRQFLNGGFSEDTSLKRFRGGFVHSDIARDIEIPVINKGGSGRKAAKDPSALDTDNWLVKLNLQDGEFSNSLLGFGMHPHADEGKDIWDETALPILPGLSSANLTFRQINDKTLAKDVVPLQNNYSWVAKLVNDAEISLTWSNTYFGDNNKELLLELSDRIEVTDMRKTNQVTIPAGTHELKFHFGSDAYVKEQILEKKPRVGEFFPNPINRNGGLMQLSISLPLGENVVNLSMYDSYGRRTDYATVDKLSGGRQTLRLTPEMKHLPSGLYILKVETFNSRVGNYIHFVKVILD